MTRKRNEAGPQRPGLTTIITAYGLHTAVDLIVDRVLSIDNEALSEFERRRLKWARAALRSAQTHLTVLFSPADAEAAECRGGER